MKKRLLQHEVATFSQSTLPLHIIKYGILYKLTYWLGSGGSGTVFGYAPSLPVEHPRAQSLLAVKVPHTQELGKIEKLQQEQQNWLKLGYDASVYFHHAAHCFLVMPYLGENSIDQYTKDKVESTKGDFKSIDLTVNSIVIAIQAWLKLIAHLFRQGYSHPDPGFDNVLFDPIQIKCHYIDLDGLETIKSKVDYTDVWSIFSLLETLLVFSEVGGMLRLNTILEDMRRIVEEECKLEDPDKIQTIVKINNRISIYKNRSPVKKSGCIIS